MSLFQQIKKRLSDFVRPKKEIEPAEAYNLWSSTYDEQTDNPIVFLDKIVFDELLASINIENKIIVDIGCGTGRHWENMLLKKPRELIGYEVSNEMLNKLHKKYPKAKTYLTHENNLKELKDESCDLIISTLVIGYIENLSKAFVEWNRVLKKNGEIIITDFHPASLRKGASRSFKNNQELIFIKNYIHSLKQIKTIAKRMGWDEISLIQKRVDESIKHFFEKNNSLQVYEKSLGTLILYGYYFKKV